MHPIEMYKRFLLKVNKNDTGGNIKIPKGQFVLLFNSQKLQWLDDKIKGKESNDFIEDLQALLVENVKLVKSKIGKINDNWALPKDFFRRCTSYGEAVTNECKEGSPLVIWFIKPKDINVYLENDNLKPSFDWQETIGILSNNTLSVYKENFELTNVYLTYYKNPSDIDIEGYTHIDGSKSTNKLTELDDFSIEEIIDRTASEAVRNYESAEQLQLAMQRQQVNEGTIN